MTGPTAESAPAENRGRGIRSQLLVAGLCLLLGFAIVTQVRQTQGDELAGVRQDDLIRLAAEITQRNEVLEQEAAELREDRNALLNGSVDSRSAEDYLEVQQILAGTAPVEGPGVVMDATGTSDVTAQDLVHVLEELRNAGAEAISLSDVRIVASSHFVHTDDGLAVDGVQLDDHHQWRIIGDAAKIAVALDIPGGALDAYANRGATAEIEERALVQITAIRTVEEPAYATPSSDGN